MLLKSTKIDVIFLCDHDSIIRRIYTWCHGLAPSHEVLIFDEYQHQFAQDLDPEEHLFHHFITLIVAMIINITIDSINQLSIA